MLPNDTRSKIKNITSGIIIEGSEDYCTTIRNFLSASFPTSTTVKEDFEGKSVIKEKQIKGFAFLTHSFVCFFIVW
jgi:hypothetical protein